jgi:shikimate dehydrogenase
MTKQQISSKTKIAGVIGKPISHSLSPKLHNHLLQKYQIDGLYLPFHVRKNEDLEGVVKSFFDLGFVGFNVTLPYKEEVIKYCHNISNEARRIGAVNTVTIKDGKIYGENSDGFGYLSNLCNDFPNFIAKNKEIIILGAGGAARAIIYTLAKEGAKKITIINRNKQKVDKIINDFSGLTEFSYENWEFDNKILQNCDLLINSTSLGLAGKNNVKINLEFLNKRAIVSDVVYNPLITKFLQKSQKNDNPISTGIGMLIFQAFVGFEKWFGIFPEFDESIRAFEQPK